MWGIARPGFSEIIRIYFPILGAYSSSDVDIVHDKVPYAMKMIIK
jgi:hypothetical protein